jgi:CBS domain-containing protein
LTKGEEIAGLLTLHHVREVPRGKWGTLTAGEVMTPLSMMKRIASEAGLEKALDEMGADGVNQLPVMSDGKVEGMLSREDIINYLRMLQRLGM